MRLTGIMPFLKKSYPKIEKFLEFRWFFVSILLGLATSWVIKDTITPLLFWGKSFDARSLFYKVAILAVYVFFTSAIYFCVLIVIDSLLIKWTKTTLYRRASGPFMRFLRYVFLNPLTSDSEKMETVPNTEQPIPARNVAVGMKGKKEPFIFVDWLKSYWLYVVIYFFFLYVSSTSVRAGDDWEVQSWYHGFLSTFVEMIRALTYFNGRLANNVITPFFGYYDFIWRFTSPAVFTGIIYLSNRLFGNTRKLAPVALSFLMLLLVSDDIRLQTYTNLTNNVGYVFAIGLILLYLNIIYSEGTDQRLRFWQNEKLNGLVVAFLAFVIGLWIENTTIGFVAANILLAIQSYIKVGKVTPYIRYGIVGSLLSCLVMFGAPGYYLRYAAIGGNELGIIQRISQNLPIILQYLVMGNLPIYLVFFLMFIGASIATGDLSTRGKVFRVYIVLASVLSIIISARMFVGLLVDNFFTIPFPQIATIFYHINNTFFDVNKTMPVIFYFVILLFVLAAVFLLQQKEKLLVLYCIAFVSAGVMAGSPYSGGRNFVLAISMLVSITAYISSVINIRSMDLRKTSSLILILAILLQMDKFLYYGTDAMQTEAIRVQLSDSYRARAASGLVAEDEWLVLPEQKKGSVLFSANQSVNEFFMPALKRHYHLPQDAKVIIDNGFAIKSFPVTKVDGARYRLEIVTLYDASEYTYKFYVRQNGVVVYESVEKTDNYDNYEFPGPGTYTVTCLLSHKTNGQKEVSAFEPVVINTK